MELNDKFYDSRYAAARKKAGEIRGFYINLLCYCIVIPVLAIINLRYTPQLWWFLFSALGWGMGLAFHAIDTFGFNPIFGNKWKERKIRELLDKENLKKQ